MPENNAELEALNRKIQDTEDELAKLDEIEDESIRKTTEDNLKHRLDKLKKQRIVLQIDDSLEESVEEEMPLAVLSPQEEKKKKKKSFQLMMLTFIKTFLITMIPFLLVYIVMATYDYYHQPEFEAGGTIEVTQPAPPPAPKPVVVPVPGEDEEEPEVTGNLSANVKAFITVEGVDVVDEAVLQHPTSDDFYLKHNEYDERSAWGAYYVYHDWNMESLDNLDRVTVIFGHSNGNSLHRKFSVLKNFKDASFAQKNQYIYLSIGDAVSVWQIFAEADYPVANNYVVANPDDDTFLRQIANIRASSYNNYNVDVGVDDKIMILSTCSGNNTYETRFIVAAKRIG